MSKITLLGRSRRRRLGSGGCGPGWKMGKRGKCIRARRRRR